jgi:hypothetical protein
MCLPGAEIMYFCLSSARTDYQLKLRTFSFFFTANLRIIGKVGFASDLQ